MLVLRRARSPLTGLRRDRARAARAPCSTARPACSTGSSLPAVLAMRNVHCATWSGWGRLRAQRAQLGHASRTRRPSVRSSQRGGTYGAGGWQPRAGWLAGSGCLHSTTCAARLCTGRSSRCWGSSCRRRGGRRRGRKPARTGAARASRRSGTTSSGGCRRRCSRWPTRPSRGARRPPRRACARPHARRTRTTVVAGDGAQTLRRRPRAPLAARGAIQGDRAAVVSPSSGVDFTTALVSALLDQCCM